MNEKDILKQKKVAEKKIDEFVTQLERMELILKSLDFNHEVFTLQALIKQINERKRQLGWMVEEQLKKLKK